VVRQRARTLNTTHSGGDGIMREVDLRVWPSGASCSGPTAGHRILAFRAEADTASVTAAEAPATMLQRITLDGGTLQFASLTVLSLEQFARRARALGVAETPGRRSTVTFPALLPGGQRQVCSMIVVGRDSLVLSVGETHSADVAPRRPRVSAASRRAAFAGEPRR
jgi:hypothetical protein